LIKIKVGVNFIWFIIDFLSWENR